MAKKPEISVFIVRIPKTMRIALDRIALRRGWSRTEAVRRGIERTIDEELRYTAAVRAAGGKQ